MKPEIIIVDGTDFTSGTNRFYGIQATVRKFLFFKKKVIALNPFCYNTPKKEVQAITALAKKRVLDAKAKADTWCKIMGESPLGLI